MAPPAPRSRICFAPSYPSGVQNRSSRPAVQRLRLAMKFGRSYGFLTRDASIWPNFARELSLGEGLVTDRARELIGAIPDAFATAATAQDVAQGRQLATEPTASLPTAEKLGQLPTRPAASDRDREGDVALLAPAESSRCPVSRSSCPDRRPWHRRAPCPQGRTGGAHLGDLGRRHEPCFQPFGVTLLGCISMKDYCFERGRPHRLGRQRNARPLGRPRWRWRALRPSRRSRPGD